MCSLVAYGSSDESAEDSLDETLAICASEEFKTEVVQNEDTVELLRVGENTNEYKSPAIVINNTEPKDSIEGLAGEMPTLPSGTPLAEDNALSQTILFSSLPEPKTSGTVIDPNDRFFLSNDKMQKKQTVKISIPSLSEFNDKEEEEPKRKKLKPSTKGSGLFSLLPAPKNMSTKETKRPLVPHILTKKSDGPHTAKAPHIPTNTLKKTNNSAVASNAETGGLKNSNLISYADSEEESDGESDFFSLNKDSDIAVDAKSLSVEPKPVTQDFIANSASDHMIENESINPPADEPLTFSAKFNPSPWSSSASAAPTSVQKSWENSADERETQISGSNNYISVQQDLQLNDEALQKLCGRRAKRQHQEMQLVEVSGDAIMPDPKEWLTKQLTQEQEKKSHSHSHRKNDGPTTQQRRKHQITYLAFQAKENELELKNQWSQNRMSRKQTQSKYGF